MCQDKYNVEVEVNERQSYINDVDDEDLEDFQKAQITFNSLKDPYEKFYRQAAKPFNKIHVRDFMLALKDLNTFYGSILSYNEKISVEQVPLGNFLKHLS